MEIQRDIEMGICASRGKVGYIEVRCKQGDCSEFLQDAKPSIGADSPMLQLVDEDTGECLGKCAHCDIYSVKRLAQFTRDLLNSRCRHAANRH